MSPDRSLPAPTQLSCLQPYLGGYITLAHFEGQVWDTVSSPNVSPMARSKAVEVLDVPISEWISDFERSTSFVSRLSTFGTSTNIRQHQRVIVKTVRQYSFQPLTDVLAHASVADPHANGTNRLTDLR